MNLKISKSSILIIVLIIIYAAFILSSDISKISQNVMTMNLYNLLFAIIFWVCGNLIKVVRWHIFLKSIDDKIPFKKNFQYYLAGFAFALTPGRMGEILRSPYIKRDYGIPISKTSAIVFIERFYDLLGITIILSIGLTFIDFDKTILLIPVSIIIFIIILLTNKKYLLKLLNRMTKMKRFKNIDSNFEELYNTSVSLMKTRFFLVGTSVSIITYSLYSFAVYSLILGLGGEIKLEEIFVIFTISMFISAISLIPAGIGVFEGGMVGLLLLYQIPLDIAVSTNLLIRLIGIGLISTIGIISLKIISKKNI
jgi:uncharacterized protein (TIRG00374 family)